MYKKFITFVVILGAFLANPDSVLGFGISPANISNEYLKPGAHYETEFFVTRLAEEADEEMQVFVETELGEFEDWFTFEPGKNFDFPIGATYVPFKVIIDVPEDAELKRYNGNIKVKARPTEQAAAGGVAMVKGAYVEVDVLATTTTYEDLSVLQVKMPDVEEGDPVRVVLKVQNNGNESAALDLVQLEISDLNQNYLQTVEDNTLDSVPAHQTKEVTAEFNTDLDTGAYWGEINVDYLGETIAQEATSFSIKAVPARTDQGTKQQQPEKVYTLDYQNAMWLTILGVLLLAVVLMLFVRHEKETDPNLERQMSRYLHENKLVAWMLLGLSLAMIFAGFYITFNPRAASKEVDSNREHMEMKKETPEDQTENEEESMQMQEEDVRGAATEFEPTRTPLKVVQDRDSGTYPIYAEPSFESEIVYEAEHSETFRANFLEDGWYRVELEDGSQGWLHESNLAERN